MSALDRVISPGRVTGPDQVPAAAERAPRARRRGFWTDTRFFLGLLLIVASIAGVWAVVALARQTSPVYAAAHTLVPGQALTAADLVVVDVALGRTADAYLAPGGTLAGLAATRTIATGELVPAAATGPLAQASTTTVVVHSAVEVPSSVRAGSIVELWSAAQTERGVYAVPSILIPTATVVSVTRDDSMIGGGATALELVIERADVADTLAAIAAQAALSIVPAGGGS
ncbi:hypothetical protein GCM10022240_20490 [Microbacterium kribbense]|uniref:SAF domain-containing protein n=1 Tax=Microbacterium kribbense TaxID=433645 RepID=A0ABP7GMS6_9MICO